jgi:hypothetical protein
MSFHQFVLLDALAKSELLYKEGIYIGKQKQGDQISVLYQLDFFYIEIVYKKYRYSISQMKCYTSTKILDSYLEQVLIEELV